MSGFLTMSRASFLGTIRDRTSLFFTVLFPLIFLIILGGLFSGESLPQFKVVQVGPVTALDGLPPEARLEIATVLTVTRSDDLPASLAAVRDGDIAAAIEQRGDEVVVHSSTADPAASGAVRGVMEALLQRANVVATGQPGRYSLRVDQVENRSLRQIQYLTPGLLGWAIAMGATFTAGSTLVSWRQGKLLRRLSLSPVSVQAVIGARLLVSLVLALAQTALFLAVAVLFFGLRLTDDWWMSIPLVLAGTLAFLSIGLLAGAKAKTIETSTVMANLVVIPMAFLSGSFFPLNLAPQWIQGFAQVLPLRHLNVGMLDVMVRGAGPASVLPEMAILLGFAVVVTSVAARLFRWDNT